MLYERRVLTDVCCLGETLSPLIAPHARHAVSMLQDFVLAYSTVGSAITAAHIASATRQPSGSTDSESAASARCVLHTFSVDPLAQQKAVLHLWHVWHLCFETAQACVSLSQFQYRTSPACMSSMVWADASAWHVQVAAHG